MAEAERYLESVNAPVDPLNLTSEDLRRVPSRRVSTFPPNSTMQEHDEEGRGGEGTTGKEKERKDISA